MWLTPILFLCVQQPLDLPGPSLSLFLLVLQCCPPGVPLSFFLHELIVHGLQLQDLLLQHGASGFQSLKVLGEKRQDLNKKIILSEIGF